MRRVISFADHDVTWADRVPAVHRADIQRKVRRSPIAA
jgi:hypothetical protein